MEAGKLRHPVEIQAVSRAADSFGGYTETWTTIASGKTFASIEPVSGRYAERVVGAKAAASTTHLVRLRYLPGITTKCRVLYGSRIFDVRGVANIGERDAEVLLACEERE